MVNMSDAKDQNRRLKALYLKARKQALSLFAEHDPAGIAMGGNPEEYDLEVSRILAHLSHSDTLKDIEQTIQGVFQEWLGPCGSEEQLHQVAEGLAGMLDDAELRELFPPTAEHCT
jgi:hypothetical protein